ncbi:hypothetical protein ACEWY4_022022 [Coilia grayii]|uniref:Zinc finger and BTB domain-containing protein 2-like n=1 Tax=Coilia grayii TaxID=363190 RepID=A0ABD1J4U9_9TELE
MEVATHGLVLLQQLNAQREFGFLCDCTVAIGDVFFKAHKAVLAAFSNYFRMLFIHQDSECVRLKAGDIQPDVFSALLNLMYTGRLSALSVDPSRLNMGVQFLHAYPLLEHTSPAPHGSLPGSTATTNAALYGIQIADLQGAADTQHPNDPSITHTHPTDTHLDLCSPLTHTHLASQLSPGDAHLRGGEELGSRGRWEEPEAEFEQSEGMSISDGPSPSSPPPSATTILHVKPSIMGRGGGGALRRQQHSCHVCGRGFLLRSALREHLLLHTQTRPLLADSGDATLPTMPGGTATPEGEELLLLGAGGGIAMATAAITAAFSSSALWEGEGPGVSGGRGGGAKESNTRPDIPVNMAMTMSGSFNGQPQADTPPPSDIADIDSLEGAGLEAGAESREVKRRKYECGTCGRKFIQKSHWREHTYIHTGKPYRCQACGKSFCRANQAARHVCLGQTETPHTQPLDPHHDHQEPCSSEAPPLEALFLGAALQQPPPYRCNLCAATFSSPHQVLKHLCFTQQPSLVATPNAPPDSKPSPSPSPALGKRDEGSDSCSGVGTLNQTIKTEEVLMD